MREHARFEERTAFQESAPYTPQTDSRADVAIVYGLDPTFETRVDQWRQAGYRIHVMTGVAWGSYQDYVRGEWDGQKHYDDAQTAEGDFRLEHGISQGHDCFYMMPSETFIQYLGEKLHRVVDAGALAIHLEEPEFWVRGGYGEGFKREWLAFYGEPWQDPSFSPDARYRAARLKQYLYTRALAEIFRRLKTYARDQGNADFKCYVPTHSLINYAHWRIVSPESRLLTIPEFDGLIAQVWTGTSRTPTVYQGVRLQRTLEAGYCEYAACAALVRGTEKRLWMLADPIEDNPSYCWEDYRENWECTVTASLLIPESERFEIMPWPRRIFMRAYPTHNLMSDPLLPMMQAYLARLRQAGQVELHDVSERAFRIFLDFFSERGSVSRGETLGFADLASDSEELRFGDMFATVTGLYRELAQWEDQDEAQRIRDALARFLHEPTDARATIPQSYSTELQVVFNALRDMAWPEETFYERGLTGIGLGISDTLMYQRGAPQPSDPHMSSFYGLAMPLVKNGVALSLVQLERVPEPGYLEGIKVLLLTYEGQKPPSVEIHNALASWVRAGGRLLLFGNGDAYNGVREWWNTEGLDYARPQDHLTALLEVGRNPSPGRYSCGEGVLYVVPDSPAALAYDPEGARCVVEKVQAACRDTGTAWELTNHLVLRRGPYVVAAGMTESMGEEAYVLQGLYSDLFDPELTLLADPTITPGSRWLLYDLGRCPDGPWVIAAAGRVCDERATAESLSFVVEGMADTVGVARIQVPCAPHTVTADGKAVPVRWDEASHTALISFANRPQGVHIVVSWGE